MLLRYRRQRGEEQESFSPGFGLNVTGSGSAFLIQSTNPAPAYGVTPKGGTESINQPDVVTNLKFNGFTRTFASNALTLTPEPADPSVAGNGIQVSGLSISNTLPMCDVAYSIGSTETVIPGNQITAIGLTGADDVQLATK